MTDRESKIVARTISAALSSATRRKILLKQLSYYRWFDTEGTAFRAHRQTGSDDKRQLITINFTVSQSGLTKSSQPGWRQFQYTNVPWFFRLSYYEWLEFGWKAFSTHQQTGLRDEQTMLLQFIILDVDLLFLNCTRYFKANMNELIYSTNANYNQPYLQIDKKSLNKVATVGKKMEKQKQFSRAAPTWNLHQKIISFITAPYNIRR